MINFPFGANGKLIILGVPIIKHITVFQSYQNDGRVIMKGCVQMNPVKCCKGGLRKKKA